MQKLSMIVTRSSYQEANEPQGMSMKVGTNTGKPSVHGNKCYEET